MHLPLNLFIVLMGTLLEDMAHHGKLTKFMQIELGLFCGMIVLILTTLEAVNSRSGVRKKYRKQIRFFVHVILALLLAVVPLFEDYENEQSIFLLALNVILVADVFVTQYMNFPWGTDELMEELNRASNVELREPTSQHNPVHMPRPAPQEAAS